MSCIYHVFNICIFKVKSFYPMIDPLIHVFRTEFLAWIQKRSIIGWKLLTLKIQILNTWCMQVKHWDQILTFLDVLVQPFNSNTIATTSFCLICIELISSCISGAILVSFRSFRVSSISLFELKTRKTIVTFLLVLQSQYWIGLISSCISVAWLGFDFPAFLHSHYLSQRPGKPMQYKIAVQISFILCLSSLVCSTKYILSNELYFGYCISSNLIHFLIKEHKWFWSLSRGLSYCKKKKRLYNEEFESVYLLKHKWEYIFLFCCLYLTIYHSRTPPLV